MPLTPVHRDDDSAEFFTAAAAGCLLVRRCVNGHYLGFGHRLAPASLICPTCQTNDIAWVQAAGSATLVSWTVVHARDGSVTSVAGIVELAEGAWLYALLDVADSAELQVGRDLAVSFVPSGGDGEMIPAFKPV